MLDLDCAGLPAFEAVPAYDEAAICELEHPDSQRLKNTAS